MVAADVFFFLRLAFFFAPFFLVPFLALFFLAPFFLRATPFLVDFLRAALFFFARFFLATVSSSNQRVTASSFPLGFRIAFSQ